MHIATTRLMTRHTRSGMTIMEASKDGFDYGENLGKTRNGDLVLACECDPDTADAEFLLSKAKHKAITGREQRRDNDALYCQIRQAFPPDETDPETTLKISYDLTVRWMKGRHAFFVVSHADRPHPHRHIYYNLTSLDCIRKFQDFIDSVCAARRLSDRIYFENRLSVIINPKRHSRGKFKHHEEWLGGHKSPTLQEKLKVQIDIYLAARPSDMDIFLQAMVAAGYEIRQGCGGTISFRTEGQERFTRLHASTLGKGYGQEDIQVMIEGKTAPQQRHKVGLIMDIQSRTKAGKGLVYERWAKVFNLEQVAAILQYLQENGLVEYVDLEQRAVELINHFHVPSDSIKSTEAAARVNAELKTATVDYAKTRSVFEGYKVTKYNKKYLVEHEADTATYRAAQGIFRRLLSRAKLSKMDTLKTEFQRSSADKKKAYRGYRETKRGMQEVITAESNIDHLSDLMDAQKNKERER